MESPQIRLWPENVQGLAAIRKGPQSKSSLTQLANGLLFALLFPVKSVKRPAKKR